jgi:hypothetical protein
MTSSEGFIGAVLATSLLLLPSGDIQLFQNPIGSWQPMLVISEYAAPVMRKLYIAAGAGRTYLLKPLGCSTLVRYNCSPELRLPNTGEA